VQKPDLHWPESLKLASAGQAGKALWEAIPERLCKCVMNGRSARMLEPVRFRGLAV